MGTIRNYKTGKALGTIGTLLLSSGTPCLVARRAMDNRVKTFLLADYLDSHSLADNRAVAWIMEPIGCSEQFEGS